MSSFRVPDDVLDRPGVRTRVFDGVTIEWALFVINNRNKDFKDVSSDECNSDSKYDIVFGPVGNDDITFPLDQYAAGFIGLERLRDGLEFKRASDQYSFHTPKAIALAYPHEDLRPRQGAHGQRRLPDVGRDGRALLVELLQSARRREDGAVPRKRAEPVRAVPQPRHRALAAPTRQ